MTIENGSIFIAALGSALRLTSVRHAIARKEAGATPVSG